MIDDLYTIEKIDAGNKGDDYVIALNPSSVIDSAHFPSVPVTPGACILEMTRKAASLSAGCDLSVKCVGNVKFLKMVDPRITRRLMLHCELSESPQDEGFSLVATISDENALCVKAQLDLV